MKYFYLKSFYSHQIISVKKIKLIFQLFLNVDLKALTSEVFHFEVFRAGLLPQEGVVEHDFSLSFDALVELPHGYVA